MPAFTKIPSWLQVYNKDICWKGSGTERDLYLTFDDGPHPIATPQVLNQLAEHKIKATFFCIGKNVEQFPDLYQRIVSEGHAVGNHSYTHRNGWRIPLNEYVEDVNKASAYIQSNLFRPPYGRLTPFQFKALKRRYKIVMWDVLSKDYDQHIPDEAVIKNVTENVTSGSIVVMHDNEKTAARIQPLLTQILGQLLQDGWNFKSF